MLSKLISREYSFSFGDSLDIITEITKQSYPMCEHLSNIINTFIQNKVLPYTDDLLVNYEYIVYCAEHDRRIDLHTALHHYGKIQNGNIKGSSKTHT